MNDRLLEYYHTEREFLREVAREYASVYPELAASLGHDSTDSVDPHVERVISAAALIAARIRYKLDHEVPAYADALLESVYPLLLRPLPCATVAQLNHRSSARETPQPIQVKRHAPITIVPPTRGGAGSMTPLHFRTCAATDVWPVQVADCRFTPVAAVPDLASDAPGATEYVLRFTISPMGQRVGWNQLACRRLVLYFTGRPRLAHTLISLCERRMLRGSVLTPDASRVGDAKLYTRWSSSAISEMTVLPSDPRAMPGFQAVIEHFAYPFMSHFFEVSFDAPRELSGRAVELAFYFGYAPEDATRRLADGLAPDGLRARCVPVVNLITEESPDPIRPEVLASRHRFVPDRRRQSELEVYSIERVWVRPSRGPAREVPRFFQDALTDPESTMDLCWRLDRETTRLPDGNLVDEAYLRFLHNSSRSPDLPSDPVWAEATCFERSADRLREIEPAELTIHAGQLGDAEVTILQQPTRIARWNRGSESIHRLVSALTLNHISFTDAGTPVALRSILALCAAPRNSEAQAAIERLRRLRVSHTVGRVVAGIVPIVYIEIWVDPAGFPDESVIAFGRTLDVFFASYAQLNCWTQLSILSTESEHPLITFPPRSGDRRYV